MNDTSGFVQDFLEVNYTILLIGGTPRMWQLWYQSISFIKSDFRFQEVSYYHILLSLISLVVSHDISNDAAGYQTIEFPFFIILISCHKT